MAFKDSSDEKFKEQIGSEKLSLIQFSASWCGPCKQLKPIVEKISNDLVDKISGKKVNDETMRLLEIQKDSMIKFLIKIPKLYYTKSHFPLEISQRAFDHLWRICESYEMWCKETKQEKLITLDILD